MTTRAAAALVLTASLAGCSASTPGGVTAPGGVVPSTEAALDMRRPSLGVPFGKYIKHIVIIVQENRSFENMFAGWPGADAPMYGYTLDKSGNRVKVPLQPIPFMAKDIDHLWINAMDDWNNGQMDGFSNNYASGLPAGLFPYSYLKHDEILPYRTMASQYVLADRMFPDMFGGSFTAHLDLIASTTNITPSLAIVNLPFAAPWGCDAPAGTPTSLLTTQRVVEGAQGPFPCFTQFRTMADTLDAAHVSWKYYAPNILKQPAWSPFDAIHNVRYGPDWSKVTSPQTRVLTDAGTIGLPQVTWVTPEYRDADHPQVSSDTGPSWVTAVVNAIGQSPDWNSTAIVLLWDDWGGWYDDAPPPQLDFKGLGIRVPCLVISPYAKKGYVSHTQYEFSSTLKFVEQTFDVPVLGPASLGYTDGRANGFADAFDFTQPPRPYVKIAAKYPASWFLTHSQSLRVPDND